jgi:hypothetical protein
MTTPYEAAYKLACDRLAGLDLEEIAFNSSARLEGGILSLEMMGETFFVKERGRDISGPSNREPKIREKILLLHYLIAADGSPLTRREVALEDIPGAAFYYPTYKARSIDLIIKRFGTAPAGPPMPPAGGFIQAIQSIGFKATRDGQLYRFRLLALPNVPVSFVFWESGQNRPGIETLKILYDAGITGYLPVEDIIVITEMITYRIIKPGPDPAISNKG